MKPVTDKTQLSRFVLKGFKSIKECDLPLGSLNILIGANGAGKSNFVKFFEMIQQMLAQNLQLYIVKQGGPDAMLHFGRKNTQRLDTELYFGENGYFCTLEPTVDNRMLFTRESFYWSTSGERSIGRGYFESGALRGTGTGIDQYVIPAMHQWRVYHFHDTSDTSYIKQRHAINDNAYLRPDASNLAAFLYMLKGTGLIYYQKLVETIRLVAPFFNDFYLRPQPDNPQTIELEWTEIGSDTPFKAHHLSDGTLRFICLATVLLQPVELQPASILIDEPELGLHPYAINVLAALLKTAALNRQIIVSTQSVELVSEFDPEDLIVVDRRGRESVFTRLDQADWNEWLEDYTLGELWKKNLLDGRPSR